MLVLSRKRGEKIRIGDHIFVTVVNIDPGKVRIAIEAPRGVPILREELQPQAAGSGCSICHDPNCTDPGKH